MQPEGIAEVERAKADGRWARAHDGPAAASVPDDLRSALDAVPAAALAFTRLTSTNRYAILYRVQDAKRDETRARRIAQFVEMLADDRTPYPQGPKIVSAPRAAGLHPRRSHQPPSFRAGRGREHHAQTLRLIGNRP